MRVRLAVVLLAVGCGKSAGPSGSAAPIVADEPTAAAATEAAEPADPVARARALVEAWSRAQEALAFDAYIGLYADHFEGIRRSGDDREVKLDLAKWRKERKAMFADGMKVSIEGVRLVASGPDSVVATLVQRYRRGTFEDHGQKRLVIDLWEDDARIVREEMLWARTGWEDDARDPIDATDMTSPITARVSSVFERENGDCTDSSLWLVLEDAAGAQRKVAIGATIDFIEDQRAPLPVAGTTHWLPAGTKRSKLFETSAGCLQLSTRLTVKHVGDRIEVVERWEDGESPQGAGTDVAVAAILAPGAALTAR